MTTRKPAGMSLPDWIERQIQAAQVEGAFDDLPGQGKPIANVDRPQHEMTWVANYLRRENVDTASLLPPSLALAKEVETLPEQLRSIRSEPEARGMIDDLNTRITRAYALPTDGPPMRVRAVDIEATISEWQQRAEESMLPPTTLPSESTGRPERRRGHGWLRRR